MIHNGIIENFQALRARLEKAGHTLASETDTEVVAHLIEERLPTATLWPRRSARPSRELEGAYSLVVLRADEPELLVGVKVSSPLVVGLGDGETILASDIPAILEPHHARSIPVEEGQIVEVTARRRRVHGLRRATRSHPEPIEVDWDVARRAEGRLRRLHAARRSTSSRPRSATRSSGASTATAGSSSTSCT